MSRLEMGVYTEYLIDKKLFSTVYIRIMKYKIRKLNRATKYFVMWLTVVLAINTIPACQMSINESIMIGMIAAIAFALLDMYSPSISEETRQNSS